MSSLQREISKLIKWINVANSLLDVQFDKLSTMEDGIDKLSLGADIDRLQRQQLIDFNRLNALFIKREVMLLNKSRGK